MTALEQVRNSEHPTKLEEAVIWSDDGGLGVSEEAAQEYLDLLDRVAKLEYLRTIAEDVNRWLINNGLAGTGHQRCLEQTLAESEKSA